METSLYEPVKRFLEELGYTVKGEIGSCDLVGLRHDDPSVVVIGELKLTFNLELVLQGVDRMSVGDEIWLAARLSAKGKGREGDPRYRNLCRHLGFGLLGVSTFGQVEILVSPTAPLPRKNTRRRSRVVEEHKRRQGDPAAGGGTRKPIMTAYRQQALACAAAMVLAPQRPRDLKHSLPDAQKILRRNVYGWFERSERGVYALTEEGRGALATWLPGSLPGAEGEDLPTGGLKQSRDDTAPPISLGTS
ncbi:hypothetical protein J2X65_000049 [Ancylobacter sp. 3268]|uniref:DUF2161 domain-containing phosphodiesterase n=1 Tax=Ancylobacter sp. 3268 TaxID=2817752 RepID=UPI002862EC54|nr:DUF2161 family putative PD-(D/E)XK-type phosphodiesterase [Ancylobacter sp. 3268]MDR6950706.1 hypothetical protein [Ancylobacter sp. 3268]